MSVHMKARHTKESSYIDVKVGMPNGKEICYHIPTSARKKLNSFLKEFDVSQSEITLWEEVNEWKYNRQAHPF
jgi:hypothetical protein